MNPNPMINRFLASAGAAVLLGACSIGSLKASDRRFTYSYEVTTAAKGKTELENWVTWKTPREDGPRGNTFDFRNEIEYGLTDKLQLGLYVADWHVADKVAGGERGAYAQYDNAAIELIRSFSSPVTDFIGSALYGEMKLGNQVFGMEGKLLLQKNFGPLVVAYNATLEAEWEGEQPGYYNQSKGTLEQTFGASYQITPRFLLGGEFQQESDLPGWGQANNSAVYVGPNASIRFNRFYVTTTAMIQATALTDEPDFQLRAIVGFNF